MSHSTAFNSYSNSKSVRVSQKVCKPLSCAMYLGAEQSRSAELGAAQSRAGQFGVELSVERIRSVELGVKQSRGVETCKPLLTSFTLIIISKHLISGTAQL